MQSWILQADIYRLQKAMCEAGPDDKPKLKAHLRRAEAKLVAIELRRVLA